MKVVVFLPGAYSPLFQHTVGQLVPGFEELGQSSLMITLSEIGQRTYDSPFPRFEATRRDVADVAFWRHIGADAAILFTWFRPHYLDVLAAVRQAGASVIVKADSDGRVAPPVSRRTLTISPPEFRQMPRWVAGRLLWRIYFGNREARNLIRTLISSDATALESPGALMNLAHILATLKRTDLVDKLWQVPNPVCPEIASGPIGPKENLVVAAGRWDDSRQKNTIMMIKVLTGFLAQRPDYRAVIVGSGAAFLNRALSAAPANVHERIKVTGFVSHDEVGGIMVRARVLFMPSVMESWGFAAAEAVCAGCSVVGTPIEPLQYLSMGGLTGTLASDFSHCGLLGALVADTTKWDREEYTPENIAHGWRALLDRKAVARQFLDLLKMKDGIDSM